jgi:hypothetical protein
MLKQPSYIFFLFLTLAFSCQLWALSEEKFEGRALRGDGQFAYIEKHVQQFDDAGNIVASRIDFFDEEQNLFAFAQFTYGGRPYAPNFTYVNYRRKKEERGVMLPSGALKLTIFNAAHKDGSVKEIAKEEGMVIGEGLYFFMRDQLGVLQEGDVAAIHYLIPSRMQFVRLQVKAESESESTPDRIKLVLAFPSFWVRLIAGSITLVYDRKTRRLLSYDGFTNIRDKQGHLQKVRIEYFYH